MKFFLAPDTLLAGIVQRLIIELNTGTIATEHVSNLKVSLMSTKPVIEFMVKKIFFLIFKFGLKIL